MGVCTEVNFISTRQINPGRACENNFIENSATRITEDVAIYTLNDIPTEFPL